MELVLHSDGHPTAEEIYHRLWNEGQHITLTTVYNNLNSLCQEGVIRCVTFNDKSVHYDKPSRHDHLICRRCGKVLDVSLRDRTKQLEAECGVSLESYDLRLFTICPDCRRKAEEGATTDAP